MFPAALFALAVAAGPAHPDPAVRALAHELAGDWAAALADWQAAGELRPTDHVPHVHCGRLLRRIGDPDAATRAVARAADLGRRLVAPPPPTVLPVVTLPARTDPLTGTVVPAVAVEPVTLVEPASVRPVAWLPTEVLALRGELFARAGRWVDAVAVLAEVADRRPDSPAARSAVGRARLAWGQYEAAAADFGRLRALDPADPTGWAGAGAAAARSDSVAATVLLHAALAVNPGCPLARCGRSVLRADRGDLPGALHDVLVALRAEPRSCELLQAASQLLLRLDQPMSAVLVASWAAEQPWPDDVRAGVFALRAAAWVRAGSLPAAERDADRALSLDPTNPEPLVTLGMVAEARNDCRTAAGHYATLLQQRPGHPHAAFRLALLRAGAPDPAVRDGAAAVALADSLPAGPVRLGVQAAGHAEAGRFGPALAAVEAALAAGPPADQRDQFVKMRAGFQAGRPWRAGADD